MKTFRATDPPRAKFTVRNDYVYRRVVLEFFTVDLMSTSYLIEEKVADWLQNTEKGKWASKRCVDMYKVQDEDHLTQEQKIVLYGYMTDKDYSYFLLKWPDKY